MALFEITFNNKRKVKIGIFVDIVIIVKFEIFVCGFSSLGEAF